MKRCPKCGSQYTDDSLVFCLQDGSRLDDLRISDEAPETETVISHRITSHPDPRPAGDRVPYASGTSAEAVAPRRSRTGLAVIVTIVALCTLFGIGAVLSILYFRNTGSVVPDNSKQNDSPTPASVNSAFNKGRTPDQKTPEANTSNKFDPVSNSVIDTDAVRQDVSQRIVDWKSRAEARDLNGYMAFYADSVDYYNKHGATREYVRNDKLRAFTTYDSISIQLGPVSVTPNTAGNSAVAVFDKEWVFSGERRSSGKVRTRLVLDNIGGRWLISGERDLKVYYTQ